MKFTDAAILANRIEKVVDTGLRGFHDDSDGIDLNHIDTDAKLEDYEKFVMAADIDSDYREALIKYLAAFKLQLRCWSIEGR